MDWFCNIIQTAFFRSSEDSCDSSALWELLSDVEPAMKFKEGIPNPMNYPGSLTGGLVEGHNLILGVQKKRVDLWVTPLAVTQDKELPPHIKNIIESINFIRQKSILIGNKEICNRLGIVINLLKFFKSNAEAVVEFNKYFGKENFIPSASKDVLFRYNNVTDERVDDFGFNLNTLLSFSTFQHRNINVQISDTNFSSSSTTFSEYSCFGKNIDVNMVACDSPINKEYIIKILDIMLNKIRKEVGLH